MKINFLEKFDLYERLEELSISVNENEEVSKIVNSALHDLKKNFYVPRFNQMVSELQKYNWISNVDNFILEFNGFVKTNKYGLQLEVIAEKLKSSGSKLFIPVYEKINTICVLSENDIKDKLHELSSFKFEPNVRNLLAIYEKETFGSVEKEDVKISKDIVSPIMETETGFVFSVNGRNFYTDNKLSVLESYTGKTDSAYDFSKKALECFKYLGDNEFVYSLPKGNISVKVNENDIAMSINGTVIKDKQSLQNTLKHSGLVNYTDTTKRSIVEFMYENANKFISLDFAKIVETKEERFEIFKMTESTFISKYDLSKRAFILEEVDFDDIATLQENLQKKYNVNFNQVLENLSINKEVLEFDKIVEGIDLNKMSDFTTYREVANNVMNAYSFYDKIQNKKGSEKTLKVLENKNNLVNSDKMIFLCATRDGLVQKIDEGFDGNNVLDLMNNEIKLLISTFN